MYISEHVPANKRVIPQVHTPGFLERDIADDGIFPNLAISKEVTPPGSAGWYRPLGSLKGHEKHVDCVAWSPDGTMLASGSYDNTLRIWNSDTLEQRQVCTVPDGHTLGISDIAWSANSQFIASASYDCTVKLWGLEADAFKKIKTFRGHSDQVRCVTWTNRDALVASGASDDSVRLWSVTKRGQVNYFGINNQWVNAVAYSPLTKLLAIGLGNGNVLLRDPLGGLENKKLKAHHGYVNALAWMPGRPLLCSGAGSGSIRVWDLTNGRGENIEFLEKHSDKILRLAFSNDGQRLASLGQDRLILWRTDTWEAVHTLEGPFSTETYVPLAFSPDGRRLAIPSATKLGEIEIIELLI